MNVYKFLVRYQETPDPPCNTCIFYEFCEETSRCCEAFIEYVDEGSWTTKTREPNYYTNATQDGITETELCHRLQATKEEIRSILSWCTLWELAFEEERFYTYKEIERAIIHNHPGMEKARGRKKAALCKILLETPGSINTERLNTLGKEIRRNI